jgi:hypothetical protein
LFCLFVCLFVYVAIAELFCHNYAGLGIMTEHAQVALHAQIAAHLVPSSDGGDAAENQSSSGGSGHSDKWHEHQLLGSVSKTVFFATMEATFGGSREGFATEMTFRSFQNFDASFPLLAGGLPLKLFPAAAKSLEHLHSLFRDPSSYADAACDFVTERDR